MEMRTREKLVGGFCKVANQILSAFFTINRDASTAVMESAFNGAKRASDFVGIFIRLGFLIGAISFSAQRFAKAGNVFDKMTYSVACGLGFLLACYLSIQVSRVIFEFVRRDIVGPIWLRVPVLILGLFQWYAVFKVSMDIVVVLAKTFAKGAG